LHEPTYSVSPATAGVCASHPPASNCQRISAAGCGYTRAPSRTSRARLPIDLTFDMGRSSFHRRTNITCRGACSKRRVAAIRERPFRFVSYSLAFQEVTEEPHHRTKNIPRNCQTCGRPREARRLSESPPSRGANSDGEFGTAIERRQCRAACSFRRRKRCRPTWRA
jgi:hypothetical protein